jgi:hypothetical protein
VLGGGASFAGSSTNNNKSNNDDEFYDDGSAITLHESSAVTLQDISQNVSLQDSLNSSPHKGGMHGIRSPVEKWVAPPTASGPTHVLDKRRHDNASSRRPETAPERGAWLPDSSNVGSRGRRGDGGGGGGGSGGGAFSPVSSSVVDELPGLVADTDYESPVAGETVRHVCNARGDVLRLVERVIASDSAAIDHAVLRLALQVRLRHCRAAITCDQGTWVGGVRRGMVVVTVVATRSFHLVMTLLWDELHC